MPIIHYPDPPYPIHGMATPAAPAANVVTVPAYTQDGSSVPSEVSDFQLNEIHAGLLIPSQGVVIAMAEELRRWRGHPHPESI